MAVIEERERRIVGGVDTHKDLHVAAVVDEQDRVIETRCFATTRQGYRQMLAWMRSFGQLQRIGIESTGSHGAGPLRFTQQASLGPRGYDPSRIVGAAERRCRRPERRSRCLRRPADRNAAKPAESRGL